MNAILLNMILLYTNYIYFDFYQYKMTQYNSLNVKLSNSQLNKFKSAIKNENDNDTNFPHKLLLTNRQVSNLCKAFFKSFIS